MKQERHEREPIDKSKLFQHLLRALITLLGAGIGIALTVGGIQLFKLANPTAEIALIYLVTAYIIVGGVFAVLFFFLSPYLVKHISDMGSAMVHFFDGLPAGQLFSAVIGLILGLVVAALSCQVISFMGDSMFTTAFSAIVFVLLGVLGYTIGYRRSADFIKLFDRGRFRAKRPRRRHRRSRAEAPQQQLLVDASALSDGRVAALIESGFLRQPLVVPSFVVDSLRQLADSTDSQRRARGQRGLTVPEKLQADAAVPLRVDSVELMGSDDPDVKLLRLARGTGDAVLTCDYNLARAAAVSGVQALNIHALANALRPTVQAGDVLQVALVKEGREPGQGVAYLPDGTMVVVENSRSRIGDTVTVTVTTALQTSAGRMVFAKMEEK